MPKGIPRDLAEGHPAHYPSRGPPTPVIRKEVSDVGDRRTAEDPPRAARAHSDGEKGVVSDYEIVHHEGARHDGGAEEQNPAAPDLVRDGTRDDRE